MNKVSANSKNQKTPPNPFNVPNPNKVWKKHLDKSVPIPREEIERRVQEAKESYQKKLK